MAFVAAAVTAYQLYQGWNGGHRTSASTFGIPASEGNRGPASVQEEIFSFHKYVKVKFDFSEEVVEHGFDGQLFMDWSGKDTQERIATVSISMPGHNTDVFIRAHFSDDFSLRCLEQPKDLTEAESDYVLLLKGLVLDYSFSTNRDDNGEYQAELTYQDLADGLQKVTKVKSRYLDPEKKGLTITKSHHEINLAHSIIQEASGEENFELLFDKNTATARTKYRLLAGPKAEVKRPQINFSRKLGECRSDFSQQTNIIAKVSPAEFKDFLSLMDTSDRNGRQDVARKILKALRANPELFADFMDWVPSTLEDRKLAALAIGMLGTLGTPAAQKEMMGIFNSATEKTKFLKNLVLNSFTLTSSPLSGESREFLKSQMSGPTSNLAEGAAYALGTSIQNDPESSESRNDLSHLVNALEESDSLESKLVYLDALGNSGSPEAFATFRKYAASENELLREKAIQGLRFVNNEGKNELYQGALNDQSQRVRQAAQEALKVTPN